jgi:hypothetical protein
LVLYGIATSGVVLSTLIEAADADYHLAVIDDCCADLDSALHDCLLQRFFPTRGSASRLRVLSRPHRGWINNREKFLQNRSILVTQTGLLMEGLRDSAAAFSVSSLLGIGLARKRGG